ncbi:porin [Necropsobacter massiliensis]|uniref:porin n=1 Tax=Necropsobacter massiliensis TaxID=1400001 RepID=UPI00059625D9|nr:porin [Necropsobacter massiliensis]
MTKTRIFTKTLLASLLLTAAGGASAAAFQLAEISTVGLGRAYAGEAAMADNASVVATNPALMSLFKTNQFSVGGIYVDSKIRMSGDVVAKMEGLGTIAEGNADNGDVVPGSLIPNLYFVAPVNDKFAIGGGMNVNFGLKSKYDDDYDAGVFGGKTELSAVNLNLSGSYRVSQGLSVGAGVNAVYARAKVERRAGILDTALDSAAIVIPASGQYAALAKKVSVISDGIEKSTVVTRLEDKNAWAFGWNVGALYEFNADNRIGIAYHSKLDIDFKDNTASSYLPIGIQDYVGEGGLILHLPSYLEISGFHQLTERFAVHYSYKYSKWSRLKNLHATYNNGQLAFHKDEEYDDNSRIALGATYDVNDDLTLRAGIAYDEAAALTPYASAAIPDTNRTWYSVGATYRFTPNLSVDVGFAHLRGKKLNFTEKQSLAGGLVTVEANYHSKATANLYGLNLNYSF